MSLHVYSPQRHHQQQSGRASTITIATTHRPDRNTQHSDTKSSQLEIAKPTPIAPPNHECSWKERYLDLTAEIRQLKAELSTRASPASVNGIFGPGCGDGFNLLEVTIILHFRDRDDIVINTSVNRDAVA
ncbi:hypothetical protein RRF57_005516 [Xylaria bambusicola]|uniref:Uncharacterized protein n=1 Tax=Xylaria bambusicola TaxID=326684 RepID=A0AAN7UQM8_9PEZI